MVSLLGPTILMALAAVPPDAVPEAPQTDTSSSEWRRQKQVDVMGEGGASVVPLPSLGLTVGLHIRPDVIAEANYAKGLASLYVIKAYSEVVTLRAKTFWGNSFYTNTGIARRTVGIALSPQAFIATDVLDMRLETTELVADLGIGNMWEWRRFVLGVDWLGVMWPIARLGGEYDLPGGVLTSDAERKKSEIFDRIAGGRSYELMRLYLGISF